MATKVGLDPGDPPPLFLSADDAEQGIGNGRAGVSPRDLISSRGLMASILVAAAMAIGIAILSSQLTIFADVATSLVDQSAPRPGTDQSTAMIESAVVQSTADAEALPPTATDAPVPEIRSPEPAGPTFKETEEASLEALFREFQAWSAEQDARALAKPVQDDAAPVVENAAAPSRSMQRQPRARTVRIARAEIRRLREHRANVRQQNERAQRVRDARAQTQSVQNAEPPSFLESLNPFAASPTQR